MLENLTVKITHENKRKDTAVTNNSSVVQRNWTVEVKATYLKTLSTATITQNKIWIWTIDGKQSKHLSTWRKTCPPSTNSIRTGPESHPSLRDERPAIIKAIRLDAYREQH